jgi:hypothetical protein
MLTNEQKEKIKAELLKKVPTLTCPMCQNKSFSMAEGYFLNTIQADIESLALGGQVIPTIGIICNNCGFVSQHAIGRLGLLPKNDQNNSDEPIIATTRACL